jgi:outer membrane biosynthesis protein TonB
MDVARRRDKSWGFFLSVILHTVIFAIAGISLIKQPEFGVDRGVSGIDVDLVAASVEEKPQEIVVPPPEEVKSDFVEKIPEPIPVVKAVAAPVNTKGKDEVTAQSTGGAISEAKPDYLNNPAPPYPYEARKKGWEGTVILRVSVSKNGDATLLNKVQGMPY